MEKPKSNARTQNTRAYIDSMYDLHFSQVNQAVAKAEEQMMEVAIEAHRRLCTFRAEFPDTDKSELVKGFCTIPPISEQLDKTCTGACMKIHNFKQAVEFLLKEGFYDKIKSQSFD